MRNLNIEPRRSSGFTLIESLIAMSLMVALIFGLYLVFASGSKQAAGGAEMLEKFQRMRIITEALKDDIREGYEIMLPAKGEKGPVLKFTKYRGLEDNTKPHKPNLAKVEYIFDSKEKLLTGTYTSGGNSTELFRTNLFDEVSFENYTFFERDFIRLKFTVSSSKSSHSTETLYYSITPRRSSSLKSKPYWYELKESLPEKAAE